MNTYCASVALAPTFEELHGVYMVTPIDWDLYSQHTMAVMDSVVKELLTYDNFYWIIRVETTHMWEERLGSKGLNYGHERELKHYYFDFLC